MTRQKEQAFLRNGLEADSVALYRHDFEGSGYFMGGSHVWLWRRCDAGIEVLLQKRSMIKSLFPGYYDVSVTGHIDYGETPIETAVRESMEEIGVAIDANRLDYVFSVATPPRANEIDHVYTYEVDDNVNLKINDEVDMVEWISMDDFKNRLQNLDKSMIVDQGRGYFTLLVDYLDTL